ncbi:MAG: hypothetical protein OXB86_06200 [Bdellovibrionales bacterium]|nr:hypothetical protein [Bdellovibrionales bacterium]
MRLLQPNTPPKGLVTKQEMQPDKIYPPLQSNTSPKGLVTIPFLIAFVIVMFLILSFFRLTLTLTYANVLQYITYSSARKLSLGDTDESTQTGRGEGKYSQLTSDLINRSAWFDVPTSPQTGFNPDYTESGYRNLFYGVFVPFTSNLISFRIPLLAEEGDQGLTTTIGTYLGREPSQDECNQFNEEKKNHIQIILDSYGVPHTFPTPTDKVASDNGC